MKKKALQFFILMYAVGVAGHLIGKTLTLMLDLTPFTLLLTGGVLLWAAETDKSTYLWAAVVYVLTFTLEVIGVSTGLVFGDYFYGDVLGLSLFNVPLIIGFNWVMVIWGASQLAIKYVKNKYAAAIAAGLAAALFDFLLEPVAVKLGYWSWEGGVIPLSNYISWFIIAFFSAFAYILTVSKKKDMLPVWYLLIQTLFFVCLLLFL